MTLAGDSTLVPSTENGVLAMAVLERMFVLARTIGTHGSGHPLTLEAGTAVAESIVAAAPPFSLQFIREAVFRDRTLLPLDVDGFHRVQVLSHALHNLGVHEVTFDAKVPPESLISFGQAVARGALGPSEVLEDLRLPGIGWREIPGAGWGLDAKVLDSEVFCVTQIALAVAEAEKLVAGGNGPWDWAAGIAVQRRLERALDVDADAATRAIEMVPGRWSIARRAVAANFRALSVLQRLDVQSGAMRSASHATLALGCAGFAPGAGRPIQEAALIALKRLRMNPPTAPGGSARHRIRVSAIINAFARTARDADRAVGIMPLFVLTYEMERRRQPAKVDFQLSFADLMAIAAAEAGTTFDPAWVRALAAVAGELPAGAHVQLHDGRRGMVMERNPNGHPLMPIVLVDGQIFTPSQPVVLIPPGR